MVRGSVELQGRILERHVFGKDWMHVENMITILNSIVKIIGGEPIQPFAKHENL